MVAMRVLTTWAAGMDDVGSRGADSGHHGGDENVDDVGSGHG